MRVPDEEDHDGWADLVRWLLRDGADFEMTPGVLRLVDFEGRPITCTPDDWVVLNDNGTWSTCSDNDFTTTYEETS